MDVASILTIIISILVPMFGGFFWLINRIDGVSARIDRTESRLYQAIIEMQKDLRSIDSRLSRLEGGFTERGYWESREKKIGEN